MIAIVGEAIVSCYMDAASFLVMIVLMLLSERYRKQTTKSMQIFHMLSLSVAFNCVMSFIYNAMYRQPAPWCHSMALIAKTMRECVVLLSVALWLIYVYHKLYGEKNRHALAFKLGFLPFALFFVLLMINLFTGFIFTYSEENRLEPKPMLYVIFAVEFLYFCSSAAIVRRFDAKTRKIRFLHISPMIISVIIASGTQFIAPYDIGVLGYVAAITLLYLSMISEYRFIDEDSGLYNKGYLGFLFDMALVGKSDVHSALVLKASDNLPASIEIMKNVLHQDGDVIRMEEKKFLMFSHIDSRSTMQYISSLVDEAADKYNTEHPDNKVHITARCRMRTANEDAFTFLRTVMDDKEAGDEMRGIVSMISELDRLDKELKLASDIQINMLPTNFPAFPERTDFDLYASMTPAKEVGGDFYDFFLTDNDHLALAIADVSGKGIPAALFMTVSKTLIKNQMMSGCDPATALERVNAQLCERNSSMMFVTVWLAVIELSTGRVTACNAGHENPGICHAGEGFELLKYKHGMFIGVNKKAKYENRTYELHPGDSIFVYTDGVTEATNTAGEMFGEDRLAETLNQYAALNPELLIHSVHTTVNRFAEGAAQFDDITMLGFKYNGSKIEPPEEEWER